ncbi:Protein kinase domain-containing protein ppk32 [Ophiocordyceps camponoti-floridani]|uniref:Protein kinase domain-containing protein ppk32 n=1 Tax=Ophiocordyceps camponoti-floridani TaxID=2030778 RepID=A0A8H4VH90_9HYPO|nr:Protein kinase domain-containing protein ppk32 [Ophiocordyceps camponoti-floridani]
MFSSALKSISATNITGNYSIAPSPVSVAGPWKIYDAKKKSTGKAYSVFVFDRRSLDSHGNSLGRSGASSFRSAVDEVVERLKKEASSLAKLRHPSILELVEPVEETRGGGLQFVTEAVTASLASVLSEKDEQESSGGRASRYVTEDNDGVRRRRELEIDELEIQKGLLQLSKALEFLHENAGLVHGNLTPDAIVINAKSDWKMTGLSFCSPAENSTKPTSIQGINLHEVFNMDPRLPRSVQLNLDFTSPDFVLDNSLTPSADMFSLGLLCVALYNSPHRSPLESHGSLSSYRRLFSSSTSTPSSSNGFLSSRPLPKDMSNHVLPRLITRRPAQRMTAREFQQSEYFDNVLVSTIRFLDSFPEKTPNEKSQFMRGLNKVLPSFPKSVMEKKILPALLEELKNRDLLSLILQNVFKIIELLPSARRAFGDKVRPALKNIFVVNAKQGQEKDPARDAGLMVFLEHLSVAAEHSSGKEFKDEILPVILAAIECPTHAIIDVAMKTLPAVLPVLDFTTIKNELFPVVASVFSRTNSLAIKVRGLQAFVVLCGGSADGATDDGLNGLATEKKTSSSSALDKYTMQERIVPLIKGIRTKEPAVMMAALNVLRIVGQVADAEFVAMEILPLLWGMSLGPLLDLKQFQAFMELIKTLSRRVEDEQTRKLQETSLASNGPATSPNDDFISFGGLTGTAPDSRNGTDENDFEALVKGRSFGASPGNGAVSWDEAMPTATKSSTSTPQTPSFAWSTSSGSRPPTTQPTRTGPVTATPDLTRFSTLAPSSTHHGSKPRPVNHQLALFISASSQAMGIDSDFAAPRPPSLQPPVFNHGQPPPPPGAPSAGPTIRPPPAPSALPPPGWTNMGSSGFTMTSSGGTQQKSGLDQYESLI